MNYISVKWLHTSQVDPELLVSELDGARFETRKIELFKDGKVGIASNNRTSNGTMLGSEPVPDIQTINSDPQFIAEDISSSDFEKIWELFA